MVRAFLTFDRIVPETQLTQQNQVTTTLPQASNSLFPNTTIKRHRSQSLLPLHFTIWHKSDILSHSKDYTDNQFSNTIFEASILYMINYKAIHIELLKL